MNNIGVAIAFCLLLSSGCSYHLQTVAFQIDSVRPVHRFSYVPVIRVGQRVEIASAFKKTADAPGYHLARISPQHPENLATPWRTRLDDGGADFGIVVMERNELEEPLYENARIYWFGLGEEKKRDDIINILIPSFDSLQRIDVAKLQ